MESTRGGEREQTKTRLAGWMQDWTAAEKRWTAAGIGLYPDRQEKERKEEEEKKKTG